MTPTPDPDILACLACGRRLRGAHQLRFCGPCTHARRTAEAPEAEAVISA
jgi:hypothetical protein